MYIDLRRNSREILKWWIKKKKKTKTKEASPQIDARYSYEIIGVAWS